MILVTGGAGFIGSNFVLDWLSQGKEPLVNIDKLTYAGNLENLSGLNGDERHTFVRGDIGDAGWPADCVYSIEFAAAGTTVKDSRDSN